MNEVGPDGKGLKVRISHYFAVTPKEHSPLIAKLSQAKIFAEPLLIYNKIASSTNQNVLRHHDRVSHSSLIDSQSLPLSISVVTTQDLGNNKMIIRLAHLFESNEDAHLSQPVSVNIASILPSFKIINITEMQLSGIKPLKSVHRLDWGTLNDETEVFGDGMIIKNRNIVTVKAMEIKTLLVEYL